MPPLVRDVRIGVNSFNRTRRDARTTVDADVRIDIQLRVAVRPVNAIDRTDVHARFVFRANAWFGDNVGHDDETSPSCYAAGKRLRGRLRRRFAPAAQSRQLQ